MAALTTRRRASAADLKSLDDVRTVVWGERLPDFRFDPHPRAPGAVLYVRDEWQRKVSARRRRATVRFPARIHLGMLDPSTTPCVGSHSYGGGIGVSVDVLSSTATVWATERPATRDPVQLHYLRLWQELVESEHAFDCKLQLDPRVIEHAGLGSNAAVGVALLAGLNRLCGTPFTDDELASIYLLNYVEAVGNKQVFHRVTTGVALATLGGGLVGVGAGFSPLCRMRTDQLYATLAIVARSRVALPARPDPITFRPELPKQLFRAMAVDDREAVLRVGQRCAEQNTRRVAGTYGMSAATSRLLEIAARERDVSVFGVTSDGPSVFALSSSRERAQALANAWLAAPARKRGALKHVVVSSVGRGLSCA